MLDTAEFTALQVARNDRVLQITLTRPELSNRFDETLHDEFVRVLEGLREETDVRSILLGSEGKVFSAGGDFEFIRAANEDADRRRRTTEGARRLINALVALPQPVVIALQGAAIGLGATIALAGDVIVASRNASLADSHVRIGLGAGDGGCLVWPAAAGMVRARRHLLTGDPLDAETAYALGLVTDLVDDPGEVLTEARGIARRIADLPPLAVQGTKRALNRLTQQRAEEVMETALSYEEATLASSDVLEGIAAFKGRRQGQYQGR